jgi:hypothetical protein
MMSGDALDNLSLQEALIMSRVRCLSCNTENDAVQSAGYCENCGRKLPPASLAHKRREPILHERPGVLASPTERPQEQQASAWLLTAAVVNLLGCGALIVLGPLLWYKQVKADFIPDLLLIGVVVLLIFAGLAWWARRQPMTAIVMAGVVYLVLSVVDMLLLPGLALLGIPVKIVVFALLIQAIRANRKPRSFATEL